MKRIYILIVSLLSLIYSNSFSIKDKTENYSIYQFNIGSIAIENKSEFDYIQAETSGRTQQIGAPDLPTYSFNYSIDRNKNYDIQYIINEFEIYENIELYPVQPLEKVGEEKFFTRDTELFSSTSIFPLNNLHSKRMSMRGYELLSIEIIPFEYDFESKELKVYTDIDIIINETTNRISETNIPRSKTFETMYLNQVINDQDYEDTRNFQTPSILYICGGDIESTSYFETLVNWRKQQGYIVYTASLTETGSSTGSIKDYIDNAYNNWENPPEHVCLIGDANGSLYVPTYTVSGGSGWGGPAAQGEGDFPYTLLEGNDLFPEMTVGRISIRSTSEFVTILNKIIGYEKNYANDTEWLNTISLVGDPYDSGISTVITNEYIEQLVEIHGGIDNINTKYSGNNYDDWMRDEINNGTAYLNYRGFYGFSGFTSNDVNQLNNGYKLPFIATLTCGTGSFSTETTCMTESLFRAGTSVSPKGAVAIIGTAQSYTHTAFNNIIDMGIFDGIFLHEVPTAGEAVVYGKLAINEIYPQNPGDNCYLFSTWNNLLGDPLTHLWTSPPQTLIVEHDQMLINGSTNFQVNIIDVHGNPIEEVIVTLINSDYDTDGLFMSVLTDINGVADFAIDNYDDENILVTSRKQNYLPEETSFFISNELPELTLNNHTLLIDDSNGNNDGTWNAGEEVSLSFDITNNSTEQLNNLNIELISNSDFVVIDSPLQNIGDLYSQETLEISNLIAFIPNNILDNNNPELRVKIYSSTDDLLWNYILPVDFRSVDVMLSYSIDNDDNNNGFLEPGESAELILEVFNQGSVNVENLLIDLNYFGNQLTFSNTSLDFNNININESGMPTSNLTVTASNDIINGSLITIPMLLSTSDGYDFSDFITIQVGLVTVNDPLGPDMHGYYIYDMNDIDYEIAPTYDWIEIDPGYGGNGQQVDIDDGGNNQDDVTTINLPFTFTFYGQDYNEVSICTNGWISFGESDMESFRNYTLPGPGGPSPIVAVFWDDLKTTSGGDVYQYYDSVNDLFIIEWSDLRTYFSNSVETFQIILYNTGFETPTGDDEMKLQYKEFNNTSVGDYPVGNYDGAVIHGQYCTVGIENHLMTDGLEYTFNNTYPPAAMPLYDQTALFITTRNSTLLAQPDVTYSNTEYLFNLPTNSLESDYLEIENTGEPGSLLVYNTAVSPFPSSDIEQIDGYGYAWESSQTNNNSDYSWVDISSDNEIINFSTNDNAELVNLDFDFSFYGINYSQCLVNPNGWIGFEEDNDEWNNESIFDEESPRAAIFAFWDDLNPENQDNNVGSGNVRYHSNSDRIVIWYNDVVHWTSLERMYDFQVVLYHSGKIDINYREMIGDVESATIGIIDQEGEYGLEIAYNEDFIFDESSLTIDKIPSWLSLNLMSGNSTQIPYGNSSSYTIDINTQDMVDGNYTGYIVINTNIPSGPDVLPVYLFVSENFVLGDINQDGTIDILDAVRMVSIIMGEYIPNTIESLLADMNEDDTINIQDIVLIVNIILSN